MDTIISVETLKGELEKILCGENKEGRKYAKAWLTHADFGGLYESGTYILNVRAEHQVDSCFAETRSIIHRLHERLSGDLRSLIWRVVVYNANDEPHCWSEDIELNTEAVC